MFRTPLQHNSGRATSLDGNFTCRVGRIQSIFISGQLKVIPLFRYSVIPYSAFYSVPSASNYCGTCFDKNKVWVHHNASAGAS